MKYLSSEYVLDVGKFLLKDKICNVVRIESENICRKKEQRSSYLKIYKHIIAYDSEHEVIKIEILTVAKPRAVVVCKARKEHAETSELARYKARERDQVQKLISSNTS